MLWRQVSKLTHIITNRTGLAEMRGLVLWLQHTSSTPDTSTWRPYVPTMLQGPLASSGEYKTKTKTTMTVQNFSLTLLVLSAKTMYKRTGSTMLGVVASVLALVCTRMQQLPTMLGPAVHCGKDTTHKTLKTMCNMRAWPQQLMLEEVCKRIQLCCATLRRSQSKINLGSCWLKTLLANKVASVWTRRKGWRSDERVRLPPMWPWLKSRRRCHNVSWVHSERFFSG